MLKKALKEAVAAPLILVVSEEIFHGIVQQGYLDDGRYRPLVRVRVGRRQRRGWVHIPAPRPPGRPEGSRRPKGQLSPAPRAIGPVNGRGQDQPENRGEEPEHSPFRRCTRRSNSAWLKLKSLMMSRLVSLG